MPGTRLNDCTPASDEQAKYATPDAKRERQQLEQQIVMALERVEEDDRAATSSPPECALPEVDVMERAHKVISDWRPDWPIAAIGDATKLIQILICALTAYGDQRAREIRAAALKQAEQAALGASGPQMAVRAIRALAAAPPQSKE
jgi:hypothetical protein